MRAILTIVRALIGFAAACFVAGIVQVSFIVTPAELAALPLDERWQRLGIAGLWAVYAGNQAAVFAAPFALIAILYALWNKIGTVWYYLTCALIIAAIAFATQLAAESPGQPSLLNAYAMTAFAAAGAAAGLTYWLIAGRRNQAPEPPPPRIERGEPDAETFPATDQNLS